MLFQASCFLPDILYYSLLRCSGYLPDLLRTHDTVVPHDLVPHGQGREDYELQGVVHSLIKQFRVIELGSDVVAVEVATVQFVDSA